MKISQMTPAILAAIFGGIIGEPEIPANSITISRENKRELYLGNSYMGETFQTRSPNTVRPGRVKKHQRAAAKRRRFMAARSRRKM